MRAIDKCKLCGESEHLEYLGQERWFCKQCNKEVNTIVKYIMTPYERNRAAVYATGNKWAIENWESTH